MSETRGGGSSSWSATLPGEPDQGLGRPPILVLRPLAMMTRVTFNGEPHHI
jgi:hypothetical protein